MKLKDYLKDNKVISIIGTAKNAGKTTVLNKIIDEHKNDCIAITSIGLDGEKIDNVTFKEKPRIKVYKKMLVATALNCLDESEIEYVIHEKTNINTPLGVIVIVEVTKEGLVLVAGPSSNTEMKHTVNLIKKYSPERIFIDGALFRKSIANSYLSDAIILSTGASYNSNLDKVVEDTSIFIDQLSLNSIKNEEKAYVRNNESSLLYNVRNNEKQVISERLLHNEKILYNYIGKYDCLYLQGAFTDRIFQVLVDKRNDFKNLKIIVKDATHLLIKPQYFKKLERLGVTVEVLNQIDILFVTFNPYSPYGYTFDNDEFRTKLENRVTEKVINVLADME